MLIAVLSTILMSALSLIGVILNLLPFSPFRALEFAVIDAQIMRFVGWAIPLEFFVMSTHMWMAAMVAFFPFKLVMKKIGLLI